MNQLVSIADIDTFEYISYSYAKDKNNVYYMTDILDVIKDANPDNFTVVNNVMFLEKRVISKIINN